MLLEELEKPKRDPRNGMVGIDLKMVARVEGESAF